MCCRCFFPLSFFPSLFFSHFLYTLSWSITTGDLNDDQLCSLSLSLSHLFFPHFFLLDIFLPVSFLSSPLPSKLSSSFLLLFPPCIHLPPFPSFPPSCSTLLPSFLPSLQVTYIYLILLLFSFFPPSLFTPSFSFLSCFLPYIISLLIFLSFFLLKCTELPYSLPSSSFFLPPFLLPSFLH